MWFSVKDQNHQTSFPHSTLITKSPENSHGICSFSHKIFGKTIKWIPRCGSLFMWANMAFVSSKMILYRRKKAKRNILLVEFYWCLSVIFFTFNTIHSFIFYKSDISFDDQQLKFQHQDNASFQDEGAGVKFDG